jgi:hypothetical protein
VLWSPDEAQHLLNLIAPYQTQIKHDLTTTIDIIHNAHEQSVPTNSTAADTGVIKDLSVAASFNGQWLFS